MNAEIARATAADAALGGQFLTFILNGEEYGVDILRVQEIKGWERATEIPNTPDYICGVINLRGTIMPVLELRLRFGMEAIEHNATTVIIVLRIRNDEGRERTMGFVVDAVSDVYNIPAAEFQSTPDFGGQIRTEYVKGLAMIEEKMVILLDIDYLVSNDDAFGDAVTAAVDAVAEV